MAALGVFMRVLQINDYGCGAESDPSNGMGGGGAEVVVNLTQELLAANGVESELFSIANLPPHRRTPWRYVDNPVACHALAKTLDRSRPDAVHLHNFYHVLSPGILRALQRWRAAASGPVARVIATAHDFHLICPNPVLRFRRQGRWIPSPPADRLSSLRILSTRWDHRGRLHSLLRAAQWVRHYRWSNRRNVIDQILCPSRFMQREFESVGLPASFLPNPAPAPLAPVHRSAPSLHFIFAGRLEPEKGVAEFIDALPDGFDARFTIVGDGSARLACEAAVKRRGFSDRIKFLGRCAHDRTKSLIAQAHVLVLPSLCMESASNVMLEALSAGTNVLACDQGGPRELVEDSGIGYRFNPVDSTTLHSQLRRIAHEHAAGTLNNFDPAPFLCRRSGAAYVSQLIKVYRGAGDAT